MADELKMIQRDEYPEPRLFDRDGNLYAEVSVPTSLWHLFGTNAKRRLALKTNIKKIAERRLWQKANQIYDEFDRRQLEYIQEHQNEFEKKLLRIDEACASRIIRFGKAINYNKGNIPELSAKTPMNELIKLRNFLEFKKEDMRNQNVRQYSDPSDPEKMAMDIRNHQDNPDERLDHGFTREQAQAWSQYTTQGVHTLWQDLFNLAAEKQGLEPPKLPIPSNEDLKVFDPKKIGKLQEAIKIMFDYDTSSRDFQQFMDKEWQKYITDFDVKSGARLPTTASPKPKQISDYFNEWDEKLHRDFDRVNTINKLKRSIRLFKNLVGNLVLDQIEPHHAYEFADAQLVNNPDVALKTLQNYNWGCQEYFKYLVERGIIKNNPFWGINLGRRGKRPKSWQPFTRDELYEVFRYDWDEELRLLLALLVVTGMRLEEAVELTWERFNDTEYQGIRYFSLLSTGFEEVNVKTESSVRYVIIHQDLELPPVLKTGRLFSFRHGEAGQRINPVLETLFNNPRKRVHSFRRTFKLMYRDEGVDEHSIDALIGHAEGDASKRAYARVCVPRRHELLSRLRHPWLKSGPKG